MATKRLYVGNLPDDTVESDVQKLFKPYQVSGVEIKRKIIANKTTVFAYVDISEVKVDSCLQSLRCKKWKNFTIKVELAKESFLERLKKERNSGCDGSSNKLENPVRLNCHKIDNGLPKNKRIVFDSDDDEGNNSDESNGRTKLSLENQCTNVAHSVVDNTSDEETPRKRKLPMFRGTAAFQEPTEKSEPDADSVMKRFEEFSDFWRDSPDDTHNHRSKVFSSANECGNISPKNSKFRAESKRLQALDERRTALKSRKDAVKKSLQNIVNNTKITFDNSSYTETVEKPEIPARKIALFESDSDNDDFQANFDGEKREIKLLNDDRFKLDERFSEDVTNESDERRNSEPKSHKNKQLTDVFQNRSFIRYDPTEPSHKVLEKNGDSSVPNEKKKTAKKKSDKRKTHQDANAVIQPPAPEVSPEKHYSVATNLKDVFKKSDDGGEFRLSALFDTKLIPDEKSVEQPVASSTSTKNIKLVKNPLESDSDLDCDVISEESSPTETQPTISNEKVLGKCGVWGETFFFKSSDSRLREAIEFYQRQDQRKKVDFDKKRTKLRSIVRKKIQNSKRDTKLFKQKLGSTKMNKSKFKSRLRKTRI